MKKKNGFTLVELLVVIALMLSILGIAIVSFVNISNNKKEEALKEVVNQIETAAKDYFADNEYLFEGLEESFEGKIAVKELINNDYLNVVTNPMTNKTIPACSIVSVKRKNGKYESNFIEETIDKADSDCNITKVIITSETGIVETINENTTNPKLYLNSVCKAKGEVDEKDGEILDESDTNGYCYSKWFNLNLNFINRKGKITSAKYCNTVGDNCEPNIEIRESIDDNDDKPFIGYFDGTTDNAITIVELYNNDRGKVKIFTDRYKIDHNAPEELNVEFKPTKAYNNSRPNIIVSGKDIHSFVERYELENATDSDGETIFYTDGEESFKDEISYANISGLTEFNGGFQNVGLKVYDKVGNSASFSNNYFNYKECDDTLPKTCKKPYRCNCNKKGCSTCSKTKKYKVDTYNNAFCGGDNYCTSIRLEDPKYPSPNKGDEITAKAYKFGEEDTSVACATNGTVNFNCNRTKDDNGNPVNCTISGKYYRRYKYKELVCTCSVAEDKIKVKKIKNTTKTTHPDGYSYLFYKKEENCNKKTKNNIVQICTHKYHKNLEFHGVKWYEKNNSNWIYYGKKDKGYWYNSSYVSPEKVGSSIVESEKKVCKWACSTKYKLKK